MFSAFMFCEGSDCRSADDSIMFGLNDPSTNITENFDVKLNLDFDSNTSKGWKVFEFEVNNLSSDALKVRCKLKVYHEYVKLSTSYN